MTPAECNAIVHFECLHCGWKVRVPDADVVLVGGVPHARYVIYHDACGAPDVIERGARDYDMIVDKPGHNVRVTLR